MRVSQTIVQRERVGRVSRKRRRSNDPRRSSGGSALPLSGKAREEVRRGAALPHSLCRPDGWSMLAETVVQIFDSEQKRFWTAPAAALDCGSSRSRLFQSSIPRSLYRDEHEGGSCRSKIRTSAWRDPVVCFWIQRPGGAAGRSGTAQPGARWLRISLGSGPQGIHVPAGYEHESSPGALNGLRT